MRKLQIALMLPLFIVILFSAGIVSAINSSDASAVVYLSNDAVHPNGNVAFRITFTSNTDQQLQIQRIGVHFDWMGDGAFAGKDLSSNPQTVLGHGNYTSDPIFAQIPFNVSVGPHTYYVGVDGVDASGNFTWSGPNQTVQVTYTTTETTPTPTATPGGNGQAGSPPSITTYLIIVAAIGIAVAVAAIVMELRKKPKQPTPAAEKANPAPEPPRKEYNYDI